MILPGLGMERDFVLALRNDPDMIAGGTSGKTVGPEFLATGKFFIIYEAVGYMRVDDGEVSIAVEKDHQRRGIAAKALRRLTILVPGVKARVKEDNGASLRAFEKAGYEQIGQKDGLVFFQGDR